LPKVGLVARLERPPRRKRRFKIVVGCVRVACLWALFRGTRWPAHRWTVVQKIVEVCEIP